jgi:hypothetical protein
MLFKQTQDVVAAFANTRRMVGEIQGNRRGSLTLAKIIRCQDERYFAARHRRLATYFVQPRYRLG